MTPNLFEVKDPSENLGFLHRKMQLQIYSFRIIFQQAEESLKTIHEKEEVKDPYVSRKVHVFILEIICFINL